MHPGSGNWHVVSGGKTKHDWSGINTTEPKPAYVPAQIRAFKCKYAALEYEKRITGLKIKFKKGMNLKHFKDQIVDHGEKHGIVTIQYLNDPYNANIMLNIVDAYLKFLASPDVTVTDAIELASK